MCECDACLDVLYTPPTDYVDPAETAYEMAQDACWNDEQYEYDRDYD